MNKYLIISLFLLFPHHFFAQNSWTVSGAVKDSSWNAIPLVNIKVLNTNLGAITDDQGNFKLILPEHKAYFISFNKLNYTPKEIEIQPELAGKSLDIILQNQDLQIEEVIISDQRLKINNLVKIESKLLSHIPSISGDNIQTMIKTMPGVASGNELSSNYSVRGGNFDENLVYINGVEIFRPALIQSGQQEGLSMANSDLVSKIDFSSGGFSAMYDDKMSSVLDIKYRQPQKFAAGGSLSLLGASAYFEGNHFNKKFSHISGFRYKNANYLLKSMETKGEYKPNFFDLQTLLTYNLSKSININFLGYYANNNFLFFPEDRSTSFGTINEALSLYIDFAGNERDNFTSKLGALTFEYRPSNQFNIKTIAAAYKNNEAITYDIDGRYSLNQLDKELGSSSFGDSIMNLGIGRFIDHARSYYNATIYNIKQSGWWQKNNNFIQWGLKFQHEIIEDRVNEWKMVDSAGYSIPYDSEHLQLSESWHSTNSQNINRLAAYIQNAWQNPGAINWNTEYGIRLSYNTLNEAILLSPRFALGLFPKENKRLYLRLGGGVYYQSVVFREIIDRSGEIYPMTQTPFSIQFVASADYDFKMMDRPFHLKTEIYYKRLKKMIPYSIDNIRSIYYPYLTGEGYAGGIDFRLNGEFVKDVESWLSISLMKSGIDINEDTLGIQPLPNDHLLNISLYFQDYIPGNQRFKMYLALFFLTGRPFGPPNNDNYYAPFRIPAYKRADIGFSINLLPYENQVNIKSRKLFKQLLLHVEVFNLLGINNTVSYNWVTVVPNSSIVGNDLYSSFAVPNRLSSRRLNLRLLCAF